MPFAFPPDADALMHVVNDYGDADIRVVYDVANTHFIGEAPIGGLRRVRERLSLVHFSDTTRQVYKSICSAAAMCRLAVLPTR
jgi:L-ribulose-5-phosphate 3-epimerase